METITSLSRPYNKVLSSTLEVVEHLEIQPLNTTHQLQRYKDDQGSTYTKVSKKSVAEECLEAWNNETGQGCWKLYVGIYGDFVGYIKSDIAKSISWPSEHFMVKKAEKHVLVVETDKVNEAFVQLYNENSGKASFDEHTYKVWSKKDATRGKEADYHPIFTCDSRDEDPRVGLKVPSPIRGILGILTAGVHVNVYTTKSDSSVDKIWVSKRAQGKTYSGCYDQIIAGGMEPRHKLDPWTTLAEETKEESRYQVLNKNKLYSSERREVIGEIKLKNIIWFFTNKLDKEESELNHIEPGLRFCFDVEIQDHEIPEYNPTDFGSSGFMSLKVDDVKRELRGKNWKPNCGLVMLDFLRRHRQLSEEEEAAMRVLDQATFKLPIPKSFAETRFN